MENELNVRPHSPRKLCEGEPCLPKGAYSAVRPHDALLTVSQTCPKKRLPVDVNSEVNWSPSPGGAIVNEKIGINNDGESGRKGLIIPEIQKNFGDLIRESFRFLGAGMFIRNTHEVILAKIQCGQRISGRNGHCGNSENSLRMRR